MDGCELIAQERVRQITVECWNAKHDDRYMNGQLAKAAQAYLNAIEWEGDEIKVRTERPPYPWPWGVSWWKPSENQVRNLVKAGALIAAEIDRLQRLEG